MWTIDPGWIIGAFAAIFGALTSVVAWVGASLSSRLDKCETKHAASHAETMDMAKQLAEVRGQLVGLQAVASPNLATAVATAVITAMHEEFKK